MKLELYRIEFLNLSQIIFQGHSLIDLIYFTVKYEPKFFSIVSRPNWPFSILHMCSRLTFLFSLGISFYTAPITFHLIIKNLVKETLNLPPLFVVQTTPYDLEPVTYLLSPRLISSFICKAKDKQPPS